MLGLFLFFDFLVKVWYLGIYGVTVDVGEPKFSYSIDTTFHYSTSHSITFISKIKKQEKRLQIRKENLKLLQQKLWLCRTVISEWIRYQLIIKRTYSQIKNQLSHFRQLGFLLLFRHLSNLRNFSAYLPTSTLVFIY